MEPRDGGVWATKDAWGNVEPPTEMEAYRGEQPSYVMRYMDGRVTRADRYCWYRPEWNQPGFICAVDEQRQPMPEYVPTLYKTCTIFSCNPHLPIVISSVDATLGESVVNDLDDPGCWSVLSFKRTHQSGLSLATPYADEDTKAYVSGRNPSWVSSLVPNTFLNPYNAPPSRGLSGNPAIVIGLMAFSEPREKGHRDRIRDTFLKSEASWRNRRWKPEHKRPKGYSTYEETPQGFLVTICCDNMENPQGSSLESIYHMEETEALVVETPDR